MSKLTPKQMAEIIRKSGTLGNGFLRKVADTLDEIDGVGYQQFMRLVAENDRLRKELRMEILQELYDSEINVRIEWQCDGGVDWKIVQGYDNESIMSEGTEYTVDEAVKALVAAAIEEYPDSVFAKSHG